MDLYGDPTLHEFTFMELLPHVRVAKELISDLNGYFFSNVTVFCYIAFCFSLVIFQPLIFL